MRPLVVSVGCPSGIGPEVSVVAAAALPRERLVLVGDLRVLQRAAEARGIDPARLVPEGRRVRGAIEVAQVVPPLATRDVRPGHPSRAGGAAQLAWIDAACDRVRDGAARGLVTGPVSKQAIARSGAPGAHEFRGHTEHLQARLGAREVVMAFWAKELSTSLVTTHLPLSRAVRAVSPVAVARATFWLAWLLRRTARAGAKVRVAVAGLNPHAGEGGLLGTEELRAIAPGIVLARRRIAAARVRGVTVEGPIPAESAFRCAVHERSWDGVVAMVHDQATIAMKLAAFGDAVNVSLGLPIVRTSVDHGTAYDRAARFDADARGMIEAIRLASRLAPAS